MEKMNKAVQERILEAVKEAEDELVDELITFYKEALHLLLSLDSWYSAEKEIKGRAHAMIYARRKCDEEERKKQKI